jgi:hypothetical protein
VKILSQLIRQQRESTHSIKMLKTRRIFSAITLFTVLVLLIAASGCSKDEFNGRQASYSLKSKDALGVSGTAVFDETTATMTTIKITLTGAASGIHPAELCMNSAAEGGAVILSLNAIDETGTSSTEVTSITYNQLIAYDGYITVHQSSSDPDIIIALGDIGGNVITTTNKTYTLVTVAGFGVSGTALFEKRVNGNTLVTLDLDGVIAGEEYPAAINLGSIESIGGGPVVKTLNNVDGTTGKSYTNIRSLDSGVDISYDNWLVYDGYIDVYQTAINLDYIICHGNIGSN